MATWTRAIAAVCAAYLLGGLCVGYYLVRFKTGMDVRETGSGGVGARNVGRLLGRPGFFVTLLLDACKGALAIGLARWFDVAPPVGALMLVAVVAGHVWPLPLRFRGGKGIATALGGLVAYEPVLAGVLLVLTGVLMLFRAGFILGGLGAFLLLPAVAYAFGIPVHGVAALIGMTAIILFAHRERLVRAFGMRSHKEG